MNSFDVVALDEALAPIARWLGTFALHSTVALALALASAPLWRRWAPAAREALLRSALWTPIVSATLQAALLGSPFAPSLAPGAETAVVMLAPLDDEELPSLLLHEAVPAAEGAAVPWSLLVTGAALALAFAGLSWLARMVQRLRRVLAPRLPETDARVLAAAAALALELGLRHSPRVSRSLRLSTPIAFGLLRPEICLPQRAASLDDASLRAMLAHELAHLRRGDAVWMWAVTLLQALFPWQVLLGPVRRQWANLVELRCDAIAAAHTSPTSVARCLVEVASWMPAPQRPLVALGMAARPSALRERVEAALAADALPAPKRVATGAIAATALAALTFAAPGLQAAGLQSAGLQSAGLQSAGLQSTDLQAPGLDPLRAPSLAGLDPSSSGAADAAASRELGAAVFALRTEHDELLAEAARLRAELVAHASAESLRLIAVLEQRLHRLASLRARLEARLGHPASRTR